MGELLCHIFERIEVDRALVELGEFLGEPL
jgi:hypothetical protein